VVGAGLMGAGIAQWLSARGLRVVLKISDRKPLGKGLQSIHKNLSRYGQTPNFLGTEAQAGVRSNSADLRDIPLRDVDLVIEAAVEKLEAENGRFFAGSQNRFRTVRRSPQIPVRFRLMRLRTDCQILPK